MGCSKPEKQLMGHWIQSSVFCDAEYKICREDGDLVGRIISYDDGTTSFHDSHSKRPWYVFKNLDYSDGQFVDGVSGATQKYNQLTIRTLNSDSLEVTYNDSKHPFSEIWVRKDL